MRMRSVSTAVSVGLALVAAAKGQHSEWIDQMTAGSDLTGPSGFIRGPFGRPAAVLDEFGTLRTPIQVFKDAGVEEYVPDVTDPHSMKLGIFFECHEYMTILYVYEKQSERVERYTVAVDVPSRTVTVAQGVGFTEVPKRYALQSAPTRIATPITTVTAILIKETSNPSVEQLLDWKGTARDGCLPLVPSPEKAVKNGTRSNTEQPNVSGKVYEIKEGVVAPQILAYVDPIYPPMARERKLSGQVVVSAVIGVDGVPRELRVEQPIGNGFDERALEAVTKYRFSPATRNGIPVIVRLQVSVNFQVF